MLSVIIPIRNEAQSLPSLFQNLIETLESTSMEWEILAVDDASSDASQEIVASWSRQRPGQIIALRLSRHFGQSAALAAGIDHCRGEWIVTIDGDGQNDPRDIPMMLTLMKEKGCDVVCGWRKNRRDGFVRTLASRLANRVINSITGISLHDYGCTLRLYRRSLLNDLQIMGDMHRLLPAYLAWKGARIVETEVRHHKRMSGRSKYGLLSRTLKVILDAFLLQFYFSYFTRPMHFFGAAGLACLALAAGIEAFVVWRRLFLGGEWISPLFFLGFFFAVASLWFLMLGALADLIVRHYMGVRNIKPYRIQEDRAQV